MSDVAADLAWFVVERHLDPMMADVERLGDELINVAPELPGANSPYVLMWHTLAVLEWWTRQAVLGEDVARDRDSEFVASGTMAELRARAESVRERFLADVARIEPQAPVHPLNPHYAGTPIMASASGVLLHLLEEIAHHHGHLDLTRDLLLARP